MRVWLRQHRRAVRNAVRKFAAQGPGGLLSVLVISIALALPAGGYALLESLRLLAGRIPLEPQISLFLKRDAKRADRETLAARLGADARLARVRYVSRQDALTELRAIEGFAPLVEALGENPLPDAFVLTPKDGALVALEALAAELREVPPIAHVQADAAWARRLAALAALLRLALGLLAGLLAVGLVAVTFNTIRLQVLTQRDEITVSMLIGAGDAFVRRPYLYLGALQGVAGGALAAAIVWTSVAALNLQVVPLAEAYGASFRFAALTPTQSLALIGLAGLLGWLGANLSVSKYLREMSSIP